MYHPFSHTTNIVSHSLIESVAVLRFCITWLVKWYYALELRTKQSQVTADLKKKTTSNIELNKCLLVLDKNIERYSLHYTAMLFFLKNLYFRTGLDDTLTHSRYQKFRLRVISESQENMVSVKNLKRPAQMTCSLLSMSEVLNLNLPVFLRIYCDWNIYL